MMTRGERMGKTWAIAICCGALGACSSVQNPADEDGGGDGDNAERGSGTGSSTEYSYESLDVSSISAQSKNWCELPDLTPAGFGQLDKGRFASLMADYSQGWMVPLHESMLGIDEQALWESLFEVVPATFDTYCYWTEPGEIEFAPPPDGELLDPQNQEDLRSELIQFIESAEELESGDKLRLAVHDCAQCDEALGDKPSFINAQVTEDGVLLVTLEAPNGDEPVRTLYITPDVVVIQAKLGQVTKWFEDLNEELRSGETIFPQTGGTLMAVARKDNKGGVSATLGLSQFNFESQPGSKENVIVSTTSPCIGMHAGLKGSTGEFQSALHAGDLSLTVPGSLNCDHPDCGAKEKSEDWIYTFGGLSVAVEQPKSPRDVDVRFTAHTERASKAQVGNDVYAEGGIGPQGKGGELAVEVDQSPEGFLVSFDPPLALGGAMTISSFSEKLQLALPGWLTDEIFDLTFGGDPRASVFVPAREQCSPVEIQFIDPNDPTPLPEPEPRPARREVEVLKGRVEFKSGGSLQSAKAGQCLGASLADESSMTLTSDWVEVGFVCE